MTRDRRILLTKTACRLAKPEWEKLSEKHSLRLVECHATTAAEFQEYFKENDIVAIANTVDGSDVFNGFTDSLIESLPSNLQAICHAGAGYNQVGNVATWKTKNVQVSNTPDAVTISTADTALYLVIGSLRNFSSYAHNLRQGQFRNGIELGFNSTGKTMGIIGLGGIGAVARDKIAAALNFKRIVYHNRRRAPKDVEKDSQYVDLDTLVKESDVILIMVPLNNATYHLVDAKLLARCKKGATIVNVSRGPVVDEHALVEALESGHVRTAGLDVYENEPEIHPKLLSNHNVLLLPHSGGQTVDSMRNMELDTISNIDALLSTGKVRNLVPSW